MRGMQCFFAYAWYLHLQRLIHMQSQYHGLVFPDYAFFLWLWHHHYSQMPERDRRTNSAQEKFWFPLWNFVFETSSTRDGQIKAGQIQPPA